VSRLRVTLSSRLCLLAAATVLASLVVASGARAGAMPHFLHYAICTIEPDGIRADVAGEAARDGVVVLQPWETDLMHQLKAANPNIIVLAYKQFGFINQFGSGNGASSSGVPWEQAVNHPEWFIKDANGNDILAGDAWFLHLANVYDDNYVKAWADDVVPELVANGWDGVLMDDVDPAGYPGYPAAVERAMSYIGPRVQAAHKLAIANIGDWVNNMDTGIGWLKYLSGAMEEHWTKWGDYAGDGYRDPMRWQWHLQEMQRTLAMGKMFFAVAQGPANDDADARYTLASLLLASDGQPYFQFSVCNRQQAWFPEYSYDLGTAKGSYSEDSQGVFWRWYSRGVVVVNPNDTSATVSFGGSYSGSGLTHATGATMPAHTGLILLSDSGASTPPPTGSAPTSPTPTGSDSGNIGTAVTRTGGAGKPAATNGASRPASAPAAGTAPARGRTSSARRPSATRHPATPRRRPARCPARSTKRRRGGRHPSARCVRARRPSRRPHSGR